MEVEDHVAYHLEKEKEFEEVIENIYHKGRTQKIAMVEEVKKHKDKYHNKAINKIDKFTQNESTIYYDSSYIVWVPFI